MIEVIEEIANFKVEKNYQLNMPKGVRGRSSNNSLIIKNTGWKTSISLREGLKKTYDWMYNQISNNSNVQKFIRK
jgi:nucleoside-diphosphate-sugar epimerase